MKIAYYLTEFPVISETFVLNQITGLVDLGHQVDILVLRHGDTTVIHSDVHRYKLLDNVKLAGDSVELMPRNKLSRLVAVFGIFARASTAQKRVLIRSLNFFKFGADALHLCLFFRSWTALNSDSHYDLVHSHFGNNGRRAATLKAVGALNAPVVTTFHGHDITRDVIKNGPDSYNFLFVHGSLFLPVSNLWQQELIKLGCPEKKIRVHRMGIAVEDFAINTHSQKEVCTILTVARLVEKKGVTYAVSAMKKVVAVHNQVRYLIVGDGPLEAELQQQINETGLQDHVQMLGWKNQEEINTLTAGTDIFLLPSVTASSGDKEGVPVVLMEAMARAIPVVSTVHSGIPELVDTDKSGYLVPERDIDSLADRLISLIQQPQLREKMGHSGREKVLKEFNIRKLNQDLVAQFADQIQ